MLARALEELSARGLTLADQRRNLVVVEVEDVPQQQHRPLRRREALEHDQKRHRDPIDHLHAADASFVEIDRLRQAIPSTLLAPRSRRIELVETQTRHDGDEIRAWRLHGDVPAAPPQPRLLHDVFRAPEIAEHAVRVRHEQCPMRFEDVQVGGGGVRHQYGLIFISTTLTTQPPLLSPVRRSRRYAIAARSRPA